MNKQALEPVHEPEILCMREGFAGVITLNRPKALNALTLSMVRGLAHALDEWEHDPAITCVVVQGAGEKAFCAGGDIRQLYELGKAGRQAEALAFWREEYILNARIKHYPKPYVSLIDGIVMGGGVGVSLHGSHVVAGEKFMFAMPEVSIGFFPDVGASYILPRLSGANGAFIALTGERVKQADALALGLATVAVASASVAALKAALVAGDNVDSVLAHFAIQPEPGSIMVEQGVIGACFNAADVADVLVRLDDATAKGSGFAAKIASSMRGKSPMSMALAHGQMLRGAKMSFADVMRMEFRIVSRICHGHDFYEGVRALIIDKDNAPQWSPASLSELDMSKVEAHFAPLDLDELVIATSPGFSLKD